VNLKKKNQTQRGGPALCRELRGGTHQDRSSKYLRTSSLSPLVWLMAHGIPMELYTDMSCYKSEVGDTREGTQENLGGRNRFRIGKGGTARGKEKRKVRIPGECSSETARNHKIRGDIQALLRMFQTRPLPLINPKKDLGCRALGNCQ